MTKMHNDINRLYNCNCFHYTYSAYYTKTEETDIDWKRKKKSKFKNQVPSVMMRFNKRIDRGKKIKQQNQRQLIRTGRVLGEKILRTAGRMGCGEPYIMLLYSS